MKLVGKVESRRKSCFFNRIDYCTRVSKHRKDNVKSQLADRIIWLHFHHVRRLISRGRVNERSRNWLLCSIISSQYLRAARIFIVLSVYFQPAIQCAERSACMYGNRFRHQGKIRASVTRSNTYDQLGCTVSRNRNFQRESVLIRTWNAVSLKTNFFTDRRYTWNTIARSLDSVSNLSWSLDETCSNDLFRKNGVFLLNALVRDSFLFAKFGRMIFFFLESTIVTWRNAVGFRNPGRWRGARAERQVSRANGIARLFGTNVNAGRVAPARSSR